MLKKLPRKLWIDSVDGFQLFSISAFQRFVYREPE
jgi:hypothetical protein